MGPGDNLAHAAVGLDDCQNDYHYGCRSGRSCCLGVAADCGRSVHVDCHLLSGLGISTDVVDFVDCAEFAEVGLRWPALRSSVAWKFQGLYNG